MVVFVVVVVLFASAARPVARSRRGRCSKYVADHEWANSSTLPSCTISHHLIDSGDTRNETRDPLPQQVRQ